MPEDCSHQDFQTVWAKLLGGCVTSVIGCPLVACGEITEIRKLLRHCIIYADGEGVQLTEG
jgi:hypothetical protein